MIFSQYCAYDTTLYERYPTQNTGLDSSFEVSRYAPSSSYDAFNARALLKFDLTQIQSYISSSLIPGSAKYYLNLSCVEAYQLPLEYTLEAYPVSQSYENGVGKYSDSPITTLGASWQYKDSLSAGGLWISGSTFPVNTTGSYAITAGGGTWYTNYTASQYFYNDTSDVNMDVTNIVNAWISGSIDNNGFILKWQDSANVDNVLSSLRFYSIESHTIFLPRLDVKWDDHAFVTQSLSYSTTQYSASGHYVNSLQYPTITLPTQTANFTYTTSSATYTIVSSSYSELTSSLVNYTDRGILNVVTGATELTGSFTGYISGSYSGSLYAGSGSGYFLYNNASSYYPTSQSISLLNGSGSLVCYFSGSFIGSVIGGMSGSFIGSVTSSISTGSLTYSSLSVTVPAYNTHYYVSGSQIIYATSSLDLLPVTSRDSIIVYSPNLKTNYKQTEKAVIQIVARPRYPEKTYSTSSVYKKEYYLPEETCFSVRDASSENESILFDDTYTKLSCGGSVYTANYFNLWMNSLQPERNYRILIKTIRGGVEEIFDNKMIFKVIR